MVYYQGGSSNGQFTTEKLKKGLFEALDKLGSRHKVLVIPPDFTRFHSRAGMLTEMVWEYYGDAVTDILPALGTHAPMSSGEITRMFGKVPHSLFRVHDWRNDVVTLGVVPGTFIREISGNSVGYPWPAQVNKMIAQGGHDLILSIGQVVPHEVIGMANYNKNLFIGTGGKEAIDKSHFLGAAYGMERIMGRADNPVRKVLNYAAEKFAVHLPVVYIHTVIGKNESGSTVVKGLFAGDDISCFNDAAELSLRLNFELLEEPLHKIVVFLDPLEFKSTWLGNKGIYRTRMALADGGELILMAPGLKHFGEDKDIDRLIRKYGYRSTTKILQLVREENELRDNLGAAAHLIHGSTEDRFHVTYCPGHLSRQETESVNFLYADLQSMLKKYDPAKLKDGYNEVNGERIYYISNPALGLWASKNRFF
ncbi:MAG: lactate racemase domain-containing protein [Bacteroidota bacterium]